MISFLNPVMLVGLAAVALPIVIHMLHRRRARQVWFPSLMFLLKIDARTMRRKRLREILLLVARCLLLALLALAAARPVLADRETSGGNTAMVLILDTSLSMTYRQDNVPRFRRAQETALRALDSLSTGDRAAAVTSRVEATVELTSDLGIVRHRVRSAGAGFGAERLRAAVARAADILEQAEEENREILVLTDMQKRAVGSLEGLVLPDGVRMIVADHARDDSANLSLVDVKAGEGVAVVGQAFSLSAVVANRGPAAAAARVSLYVGDERVGAASVNVGTGERPAVTFEVVPEKAGDLEGRVVLDSDALPGDDGRVFTVPILDRVEILVVNGDASNTPWLDEVMFLRAALDPSGLGVAEVETPFRLTLVTPEDMGTRDLNAFRAVILANVGDLAPAPARDLATFVRRGGGLVVFAGSRMGPDACARTFGPGGPAEAILPRIPTRPLSDRAAGGPLPRIGEVDSRHPLLRGLDESLRDDFGRLRCTQALDLSGDDGRDIVKFEDGRPFLVEGEAGLGRVLQFAITADSDWTNLPKRPLFLPLLHRSLFRVMGSVTSRAGRLVGEGLPLPDAAALGPGGSIEVYTPGKEDDPARFTPADRTAGVFQDTDRPGLYRVVTRSSRGVRETVIPVNVDPDEGVLDRSTVDALGAAVEGGRVESLDPSGDVTGTLRGARRGRPVWGVLLALALLLLLVETGLANHWTRPPAQIAVEAPEDVDPFGTGVPEPAAPGRARR